MYSVGIPIDYLNQYFYILSVLRVYCLESDRNYGSNHIIESNGFLNGNVKSISEHVKNIMRGFTGWTTTKYVKDEDDIANLFWKDTRIW